MFQFLSVNVCICTSISWYPLSHKIDPNCIFRAGKNFSPTISLFFLKMTAEVSRNNCAKRHKAWRFPWVYFRHLKVSWVKAYHISCLFIFTSIYPLTRLKGLAVEIYRMKRLLNWLEVRTLFMQQKITEKVGLYPTKTVTVSKSWTIITLEKEMEKSFIIIQKW